MAKKPHHKDKKKNKRQGKFPKGGKKTFSNKKKPSKDQVKRSAVDKQVKNPDAKMRLNKYIANSGVCSRRDADIFIASGNVTVNGEVVTKMGYKVNLDDEVKFDGRRINPVKKEYILLNKPAGIYVTGSLEKNNRTVMDIIGRATKNPVNPVGSLETSVKGLLLFTNDGTLEKKLAKKGVRQIYHLELKTPFSEDDMEQLRNGVGLEEGFIKPIDADYVEHKSNHHVGIELTSTLPQIVQKILKKLGYTIINMDRVVYGQLTKKNLPRGHYRNLTKQEIINLGIL